MKNQPRFSLSLSRHQAPASLPASCSRGTNTAAARPLRPHRQLSSQPPPAWLALIGRPSFAVIQLPQPASSRTPQSPQSSGANHLSGRAGQHFLASFLPLSFLPLFLFQFYSAHRRGELAEENVSFSGDYQFISNLSACHLMLLPPA